MHLPSPHECALLTLHLLQTRDEKKGNELTRARFSELTLKRVCCRPRLSAAFLEELQDAMLTLGWCLFYADRSYALIKLDSVENWTRLGSKRIRDDLNAVVAGKFDFSRLVTAYPAVALQDD